MLSIVLFLCAIILFIKILLSFCCCFFFTFISTFAVHKDYVHCEELYMYITQFNSFSPLPSTPPFIFPASDSFIYLIRLNKVDYMYRLKTRPIGKEKTYKTCKTVVLSEGTVLDTLCYFLRILCIRFNCMLNCMYSNKMYLKFYFKNEYGFIKPVKTEHLM